jgi:hypothetical protein
VSQPLCLDEPDTSGRVLRRKRLRFRAVWAWLSGLSDRQRHCRHRQPSESAVVHDHIRPGQHQTVAIACISIRPRHVQHPGTTQRGETVGRSSGSGELSPGRGSTEMISDRRTDANGKLLVKRVRENLPPTAQCGEFGGRALR